MIDNLLEKISHLSNQESWTAFLVFAALCLILFKVLNAITKIFSNGKRRSGQQGSGPWAPKKSSNLYVFQGQKRSQSNDLKDPAKQLQAISLVNFTTTRLLNQSEKHVFNILENHLKEHRPDLRLMAQTSMGEIIKPVSPDKRKWARANASINSKRLDYAIFNDHGIIVAALEYQGTGHYHQNSFMRDAVKREVFRRAKVPFIEIPKDFDEASLCSELLLKLGENNSQQSH